MQVPGKSVTPTVSVVLREMHIGSKTNATVAKGYGNLSSWAMQSQHKQEWSMFISDVLRCTAACDLISHRMQRFRPADGNRQFSCNIIHSRVEEQSMLSSLKNLGTGSITSVCVQPQFARAT